MKIIGEVETTEVLRFHAVRMYDQEIQKSNEQIFNPYIETHAIGKLTETGQIINILVY